MKEHWNGHYIRGVWLKTGARGFSSLNPSDGEPVWTGRCATRSDIDAAVDAANDAFPAWSKLPLEDRLARLHAFVDLLKANRSTLSARIAAEIGKPRWEAATEVAAMIGKLEPSEQAYKERNTDSVRQQPNGTSRTRFRPHGVVAVIGPYNFPGHMPNGHILPALLAGNTIVFKPSENAPSVAELTAEYWSQAGLPSGVFNLVQGDGTVGAQLCEHEGVKAIFFTGSLRTGEMIRTKLAREKICALEMGGNSPLVVWDASNIEGAVFATIQSAFITSGQRCSSARRLIVPSGSFAERFLARLARVAAQLRVGRTTDSPEPYMGPLRSPAMVQHLLGVQESLIARGALVLLKSSPLGIGPAFVTPGILDVTELRPRDDEEIIGPFLRVIQVPTFASALTEANNTKYGLAAGLISDDPARYEEFQNTVRAGILNWNQQLTGASAWAPFGGIKDSGNFRPSGYLAADYCVYSTGSMEVPTVSLPNDLPPGVSLGAADPDESRGVV